MTRRHHLLAGILGLLSMNATLAYAEQGWQSEWGMGITSAWVDLGPGNHISVSCTGGYGQPIAGVEFMLGGRTAPANSLVTVTVDAQYPLEIPVNDAGILTSDNRVEAQWFDVLLVALKEGRSAYVRFSDGTGARFSLAGSGEAIGYCPADFWRTDLDRS